MTTTTRQPTALRWERKRGQYTSGEAAFLGKWEVGGWHWSAFASRDDPRKYRATLHLPGMKDVIGNYEREEDAKARVELAVGRWIEGAFGQEAAAR